ncbi:putative RNA-directed DNA polymerase [Tanacetum coccineum]
MDCKPKPRASIYAFVLEMKWYFGRLEHLNMVFDVELSINIILSGLPADYNQFMLSYQINRKETSIMKLYSLLQTTKQEIKKIDVPSTSSAPVLTVGHNANKRKTSHSNWNGKAVKGKSDCGYKRKSLKESRMLKHGELNLIKKIDVPSTSAAPVLIVGHNAKKRKTSHSNWKGKAAKGKYDCGSKRKAESEIAPTSDPKEAVCFYCNTKGHWKHSCLKYFKDLKDGKGLKKSRMLKHGELNLVMGNRKITPVTRIGKYELMLKSRDGYKFSFDNENGDILVYSNGCFMFKASPCEGIYEIVECISHNGNVIINVGLSNELDKSKLWHSRLGHVNKKRIAQLKKDGVGEEYFSIKFFDHLKNYGIVSQLTPPRTPQLNGISERRNRTLLDMVRSMMIQATLPISFWGYALETVAYILNLVPTKKVSKTPFEMWKGKRPYLKHIKIWGCEVYVRGETQDKLEARSKKCLFVGYPEESFGYLFYKLKDNVVFVARKGMFLKREMISKEDSGSKIDLEEIPEYADEEPIDKISDSTLSELDEPANYKEAMASLEAAKWKEAMKRKIQFMYDNQVRNSVDTTPDLKTVGCKWILKKKTDMDGKVHTYKDRLVAKGYTQTRGIDHKETFSPVAKIKSIRIMLAIAAFHDYEIWKMDVRTAFLNGKLTEYVFMTQPKEFENEKYPKRVFKLQNAIYGLKQASRSYNLCFHKKVTQFGFSKSEDESCIYVKVSGSVVVFLVLYVDDILPIGNDILTLQSVKHWLGKCFAIKELGDATYILGIKIYRDRSKRLIGLSQDTYLDKILKRLKMENSKKGNLPLHHGIKISKDLCPKTDKELDRMSRVPYASAVGSIMYSMTFTRHDISFALSMVSRHQQYPGEGHWTAVKNILKYLRNTKDRFLVYGGEEELKVTGYCDGAVTWKGSKQDTMVDSTCESEYIVSCEASKESIWIKNFIGDLGVVPTVQDPIGIFCDNKSAVALTKEPKDHGKSKHIEENTILFEAK